jgi:hypothetical protein
MPVGQLGKVETMPMDDGGFTDLIAETDANALTAANADDGTQV